MVEMAKDKLQEICDVLKNQTLLPAEKEAKEIVEKAKMDANQIIEDAKTKASGMMESAKIQIENDRKVFDSSLNIAAKQVLDDLKISIERKIFNDNLKDLLKQELANPKIISQIIITIIKAIDEQGLESDVSAYIGQNVSAKEVNQFLLDKVKDKLKEKEILISDFEAGVKIKLHNMQITIDLSLDAIKEVVARYIRGDFQRIVFSD
jgi:V/A-type H+/Na+-transporting ATPase subunit E